MLLVLPLPITLALTSRVLFVSLPMLMVLLTDVLVEFIVAVVGFVVFLLLMVLFSIKFF